MKPDFIFIGASKCATSTISAMIEQHPDVFMISKETSFFSNDDIYAQGSEWYESFYVDSGDAKVLGERNNLYSMREVFPKTASRVAAYSKDLKLIYCVRNPIERIESYWLEIRSHGGEAVHYDFNTAVKVNREWLVDASNYWRQINAFRPYFPDDQILIIFFEDFKKDSDAVMRRCLEFIGVDPNVPIAQSQLYLNPSAGKQIQRESLSRLRTLPLFSTAVKLIPKSLRDSTKQRFFFKAVKDRPNWDPEVRKWVADLLEEDTASFLEHCGKPSDLWKLKDEKSNVIP